MQTRFLVRWWSKKYNLPPTDPRYLAYTQEDLLLEFYEDVYEKKPSFTVDGDDDVGDADEDIEFESSGDALMDEIARREARGEDTSDLLDAVDPPKPAKRVVVKTTEAVEPAPLITDGSFVVR
jgi:hypothetical protein